MLKFDEQTGSGSDADVIVISYMRTCNCNDTTQTTHGYDSIHDRGGQTITRIQDSSLISFFPRLIHDG